MIYLPENPDIDGQELAELYREVSIAIINGRLQYGRKRKLAHALNYSEVTFSQNIGSEPGSRFGFARAEEIAWAVFADNPQQRKLLIDYLRLSHKHEVHKRRSQHRLLNAANPGSSLNILRQTAFEASMSRDLPNARERLSAMITIGANLLSDIARPDAPLDFAEVCILVADASIKKGYYEQALFFAILAERTLRSYEDTKSQSNQEREDALFLTAIHNQANALHHLDAYGHAIATYDRAEYSAAFKRNSNFWKPIFYRDKISTRSHIPRAQIREIKRLADEAANAIQAYGDASGYISELLIDRAFAGAAIKLAPIRGVKSAQRRLQPHVDRAESKDVLGAVITTMLYRTQAQICWNAARQTPWEDWLYFVRKAVSISISAGIGSQTDAIRSDFGIDVEPIIDEISTTHATSQ